MVQPEKIMKLSTKKARMHKKMKVKDETPGALIEKMNKEKTTLPSPATKLGVAIRGLI